MFVKWFLFIYFISMKFFVYLFFFFISIDVFVVFIYVFYYYRFIIDLYVVMMVNFFIRERM